MSEPGTVIAVILPQIKRDGADIDDHDESALLELRWTERLNAVPVGEMTFLKDDLCTVDEDWFASEIEISFAAGQDRASASSVRSFKGEVVRVSRQRESGSQERITLEIRPKIWRLSLNVQTRGFEEKTLSDIASEIISESGMSSNVDSASFVRNFTLQYQESDLDFLTRLLEEEGFFYFIDEDKVEVKAPGWPGSTVTLVMEDTLAGVEVDTKASMQSVQVLGWDYIQNRDVVKSQANATFSGRKMFGESEFQEWTPVFGDEQQCENWGKATLGQIEAQFSSVRGETLNGEIQVGQKVDCNGVVDSGLQVGVIETIHHFDNENGFRCEFQGVKTDECPNYSPPRVTPRPVIAGVFPALITDGQDQKEGTDPDGLCRVRMKFPYWGKDGDDLQLFWARVAQPWGKGQDQHGAHFWPRIDDEVLVAFEDGNPDRPIVIGSLYNGLDKPPDESEAWARSGFFDNENQLLLQDMIGNTDADPDDGPDADANTGAYLGAKQAGMLLYANGATKMVAETGNMTFLANTKDINVTAASGKINVESATKMTFKVGGSEITLEPAKITIKSTQIAIEGSAQTEVKGATVTLNGSAMTEVKGALVKIN
jgi:type VI secretion system secreted protein VgrG